MTRYFYHGTDPIRLTKIRKSGLCYGLPRDQRRFPQMIYRGKFIDIDPGIYVTRDDPFTAASFSQPAHHKEFGFDERYRREANLKEPFLLLRFPKNDPALDNCENEMDMEIGGSARILRCQNKCIKPNVEMCFMSWQEHVRAITKKGKFSCKWKPLRWT